MLETAYVSYGFIGMMAFTLLVLMTWAAGRDAERQCQFDETC